MRKLTRWIEAIIITLSILILLWGVASFIDVNIHNGFGGSGPSDWNLFKILMDLSDVR